MADTPSFDAADLASSILELDEPVAPEPGPMPAVTPTSGAAGSAIGWVLLVALVIAVSVAISLAVQRGPETGTPPERPCGGLYNQCCVVDDYGWEGDCEPEPCDDRDLPRDNGRGLFDAEDRFAERPRYNRC